MSAIIKNIARVSALKADVDTINTNLTDNYATIAYTNDKVGSIDFTPVNTQITEIKNTIGSNFDATNNTISAVIGSGYNSTNTVKASVDLVRSDVDLVRSDHDADINDIKTKTNHLNGGSTLTIKNPIDSSQTIDIYSRLKSLEIYDENGTLIN